MASNQKRGSMLFTLMLIAAAISSVFIAPNIYKRISETIVEIQSHNSHRKAPRLYDQSKSSNMMKGFTASSSTRNKSIFESPPQLAFLDQVKRIKKPEIDQIDELAQEIIAESAASELPPELLDSMNHPALSNFLPTADPISQTPPSSTATSYGTSGYGGPIAQNSGATSPPAGSSATPPPAGNSNNSGNSSGDDDTITPPADNDPPPANKFPQAHAGSDIAAADQDNDGFEQVIVDGSLSVDTDGSIVSHSWYENGILIATGSRVSFSVPIGTHVITLVVIDNNGAQSSDDIVITVSAYQPPPMNQPPIANAGRDQVLIDANRNGVETVILNGDSSYDPDGSINSYEWREDGVLIGTSAVVTLSLPIGIHIFQLTVVDDQQTAAVDVVTIAVNRVAPAGEAPICASFEATEILPWQIEMSWSGLDRTGNRSNSLTYSLYIDGNFYAAFAGDVSQTVITQLDPNDPATQLLPNKTYTFDMIISDPIESEVSCATRVVKTRRELSMNLYLMASGANQACSGIFCRNTITGRNFTMELDGSQVPASLVDIYGRFGFSKLILVNYPLTGGSSPHSLSTPQQTGILETEDNCRAFFSPIENLAAPYKMKVVPGVYALTEALRNLKGDDHEFTCGSGACNDANPLNPIAFVPGAYMDPSTPPSCDPNASCVPGSPDCNACMRYTVSQSDADTLWSGVEHWLRNAGRCTNAHEVYLDNEFIFWATADKSYWFVDESSGQAPKLEKFWFEDVDAGPDESSLDNNARDYFKIKFQEMNQRLADEGIRLLNYHPLPHPTHQINKVMNLLYGNDPAQFQTGAYRLTEFYPGSPYFVLETGDFPGISPWEKQENWFTPYGVNHLNLSQGFISKVVGEDRQDFNHFGYSAERLSRWWLANQQFSRGWFFHGIQSPFLGEFANRFGTTLTPWYQLETQNDTNPPVIFDPTITVSNVHAGGMTLTWAPATDDSDANDGYSESLLVYYIYYCRDGDIKTNAQGNPQSCNAGNMGQVDWIESNTDTFMYTNSLVKLYTLGRDIQTMMLKEGYPFFFEANKLYHVSIVVKDPSGNKSLYTTSVTTNDQDMTPPNTSSCGPMDTTAVRNGSSVDVSWNAANDDTSQRQNLIYSIYQCPGCNAFDFQTVAGIEQKVSAGQAALLTTATGIMQCASTRSFVVDPGTQVFNIIVSDQAGNKTAYLADTVS